MPPENVPGEIELLADIDARQNAVLEQLDQLNDRIEATINEFAALRLLGMPEEESPHAESMSTPGPRLADAA